MLHPHHRQQWIYPLSLSLILYNQIRCHLSESTSPHTFQKQQLVLFLQFWKKCIHSLSIVVELVAHGPSQIHAFMGSLPHQKVPGGFPGCFTFFQQVRPSVLAVAALVCEDQWVALLSVPGTGRILVQSSDIVDTTATWREKKNKTSVDVCKPSTSDASGNREESPSQKQVGVPLPHPSHRRNVVWLWGLGVLRFLHHGTTL